MFKKIWDFCSSLNILPGLIILFIVITYSYSCTQSDDFTIGDSFVESQTELQVIDTFKVELSTVLLDSVNTSSTGIALVGKYSDDVFGTVNCSGYFELGYTVIQDVDESAVYDSAVFILGYSGYSYGDTLSTLSIGIHQLTELMVLNDNGYLYNNSSFDYSHRPLGSKLFYPEPNSADSTIRISVNDFGEELFIMAQNNDVNLTTSDLFTEYLKGFVITSDDENNNSVIGFLADETHLILEIYYHIDEGLESVEYSISLPFGTKDNQFNSIKYDFSATEFSEIFNSGNELSSAASGDKAFLQGGLGLLPKVSFPTLQDIFLENRWSVLKAELVIEPEVTSYDFFELPSLLYLYETDRLNRLNGVLSDNNSNEVQSTFQLDEVFKEDTRYTFDISSYIIDELSDTWVDPDHNLLIGFRGTDFTASLARLVVNGKDPSVKLRLYYLSY